MNKVIKYLNYTVLMIVALFLMGMIDVDAAYCVYNHNNAKTKEARAVFKINDNKTLTLDLNRSSTTATAPIPLNQAGEITMNGESCPTIYFYYVNSTSMTGDQFAIYGSSAQCDSTSMLGGCKHENLYSSKGKKEQVTETNTKPEYDQKATCQYVGQTSTDTYIRIEYNNRNDNPFIVSLSTEGKGFKKVAGHNLNLSTFPFDGECPATIKANVNNDWSEMIFGSAAVGPVQYIMNGAAKEIKFGVGEQYINIKESSVAESKYKACTNSQIEEFKKEEQELFNNFLEVRSRYLDKIKNKVADGGTDPDSRLSSLRADLSVVQLNFERVYKRDLEKLAESYKCTGLPQIDRESEANLEEITTAYKQAIEELRQEAEENGDLAAAEEYNEYIENEMQNDLQNFLDNFKAIFETLSVNWNFGENVGINCEGILGDNVIAIIQEVFDIIKIAAPILLILFGAMDFSKAVLANDNDALKKATSNFVKRTIATVAIFFLPLLIKIILGLPGIKETVNGGKEPLCGISKVVLK